MSSITTSLFLSNCQKCNIRWIHFKLLVLLPQQPWFSLFQMHFSPPVLPLDAAASHPPSSHSPKRALQLRRQTAIEFALKHTHTHHAPTEDVHTSWHMRLHTHTHTQDRFNWQQRKHFKPTSPDCPLECSKNYKHPFSLWQRKHLILLSFPCLSFDDDLYTPHQVISIQSRQGHTALAWDYLICKMWFVKITQLRTARVVFCQTESYLVSITKYY